MSDPERRPAPLAEDAGTSVAARDLEVFAYVVSHDLRAALRAVDFFGQELAESSREALGTAGQGHLDRILSARRRMVKTIDGLMAWYHLGRGELRPVDLKLGGLVEEVVAGLRQAEPTRVVEVRIEPGLEAWGDARLVRAILGELIGNAWKFTGKRAEARVEVGRVQADGVTAFFVRDNGAGFPMSYAGSLFTRVRRLHGQDEFEGAGIGLLGVHRAVERHRGRVWAESVEGQGATFYFTLALPR